MGATSDKTLVPAYRLSTRTGSEPGEQRSLVELLRSRDQKELATEPDPLKAECCTAPVARIDDPFAAYHRSA